MERTVKPLKYTTLPGLSQKQLSEHHDVLYAGYVKKINEIRAKLTAVDKTTANATYSDLRELKVEETFALNGVKLHESYFNDLGGDGKPHGPILQLIERDFGGFDKWAEEFKAEGLTSRGWVVLAYDLDENRLFNFVCDLHNQGGIWAAVPILVLDVYEHAYFIDYGTGRKNYLEIFMQNIDWHEVNRTLERYKIKL